MSPEELNGKTGKIHTSNVRAEIYGTRCISDYFKTNDILKLLEENDDRDVRLVEKTNWIKGKRMESANNSKFNFKLDLRSEHTINPDHGRGKTIVDAWKDSRKTFRLINRVSFIHEDRTNPTIIDLSIVKSQYTPCYTMQQSNIFNLPESYEIEIEVRNKEVENVADLKGNVESLLEKCIKKTIQDVLCGVQNTDFPISIQEQREVYQEYFDVITIEEKEKDYTKMYGGGYFIGPSSVTLHPKHIIEPDENITEPNIRVDYTVTDKADGERFLLFVSANRKIYMINNRLNVIFTGCVVKDDYLAHWILDGEYVTTDKNGTPVNAFYGFDVYFVESAKKVLDVRFLPFYSIDYVVEKEKYAEKLENKFRHGLLTQFFEDLSAHSIVDGEPSPMQFYMKTFYPLKRDQTIFDSCNEIKKREDAGGFVYNIDGLIFTPMFLEVGAEKIGGEYARKKTTWYHSLKWKPEKYNSIDFL
jgi:hypothetical protein